MPDSRFIRLTVPAAALCALIGFIGARGEPSGERPNVVLIVADDLGYGDLACHGNPVARTPHLDRLHERSARLTDFHVDPTCSPTRAALMSGRYSHRVNVWHTIMGRSFLARDVATLPAVFRRNGYRTAHVGKWHLGGHAPFRPSDRGFEHVVRQGDGGTGTINDHWANDRVNDVIEVNGERERSSGYTADVFFRRAMDFIGRERSEPFFVHLSTYVPHRPWSIPDRGWLDPYKGRVPRPVAHFYASIERLDRNVGRLCAFLRDRGLAENTILLFISDNGTSGGSGVFNAGMRGKKGSVMDGGHRVPCFIRWPAGGIAGGFDVDELSAHIDLLPTLSELCGLSETPEAADLDGRSLAPLLRGGEEAWPDRTLVVENQRVPHPRKSRPHAVMSERWRLVDGEKLYDIREDPGQTTNVAEAHPAVVERLRGVWRRYWQRVSANDDRFARPLIGSAAQPKVRLTSQDWFPAQRGARKWHDYVPWNQGHVARGVGAFGRWPVRVVSDGRYEITVRRWPRESGAAIRGAPSIEKRVDAYVPGGEKRSAPVTGLLTGGRPKPEPLPVERIRLRIGEQTWDQPVRGDQRAVRFRAKLAAGKTSIRATMLDGDGEPIAGAYYVTLKPAPGSASSR